MDDQLFSVGTVVPTGAATDKYRSARGAKDFCTTIPNTRGLDNTLAEYTACIDHLSRLYALYINASKPLITAEHQYMFWDARQIFRVTLSYSHNLSVNTPAGPPLGQWYSKVLAARDKAVELSNMNVAEPRAQYLAHADYLETIGRREFKLVTLFILGKEAMLSELFKDPKSAHTTRKTLVQYGPSTLDYGAVFPVATQNAEEFVISAAYKQAQYAALAREVNRSLRYYGPATDRLATALRECADIAPLIRMIAKRRSFAYRKLCDRYAGTDAGVKNTTYRDVKILNGVRVMQTTLKNVNDQVLQNLVQRREVALHVPHPMMWVEQTNYSRRSILG